eukprot:g7250.t1
MADVNNLWEFCNSLAPTSDVKLNDTGKVAFIECGDDSKVRVPPSEVVHQMPLVAQLLHQLMRQPCKFKVLTDQGIWHDANKIGSPNFLNGMKWHVNGMRTMGSPYWRSNMGYMCEMRGELKCHWGVCSSLLGREEPPCLWLDTFRADYLEAHPDWSYEIWSDERVAKLPMFNEKIYVEEKMWQCKADILRLEFLWHHGGVYVDADMISVGKKSLNPITGFVIAYEPDTKDKPYSILGNSVIACTPKHPLILMLILTFYQKRNHIEVFAVTGPVMYTKCLVDSCMPIFIAAQELLYPAFHFVPNPDAIDFSRFPKCLMFQFGYTCSGLEGYVKRRNRCKRPSECPFHAKTPYAQSYKALSGPDTPLYGQVPVAMAYLEQLLSLPVPADGSFPLEEGTALFLVDGEIVHLVELRQQVPGFMGRVRHQPWDVVMLGMEWSTGADEVVLFNVPPGGRPKHSNCLAIIVNVAGTKKMQVLRPTLQRCVTPTGFDPSPLFNSAGQLSLWFAAQKNLLKGQQDGRMVFEMVLEPNGGIMFRSWNDDNSPNCEMKSAPGRVEWMKVFYNHAIVFEAQNKPIS